MRKLPAIGDEFGKLVVIAVPEDTRGIWDTSSEQINSN